MEITRELVTESMNDPEALENLYRSDKKTFSQIIRTIYEQESNPAVKYWYARLFYTPPSSKKNNTARYLFTAILIIVAWLPIRLMLDIKSDILMNLFLKAIPIVFSITLSFFFMNDIKNKKNIGLIILLNAIMYIYMIFLPDSYDSQALTNTFSFMFIILWFFILLAYSNFNIRKLLFKPFLEKCGETIVWTTILSLGGTVIVVLSGALFSAIEIDVWEFYEENIVTLGLVALPFVSLLIIENYKKVKLSVVIANVFLPLIVISLVAFGIASIFTKTKPYEDRDIFITYNIMMVLVICVLTFTSTNSMDKKIINICSYILPVVTVILDIVTISAVLYRLNKYGISANKITLLGTNIFMLGHLVYMIYLKFKGKMEHNTLYLPLYCLWAVIVVFVFPFIFEWGLMTGRIGRFLGI